MLDLLVIGAGLAGLTAALRAAEAGLRVKVIAKGMGALHWSAGTVDVLGYLPGSEPPVRSPWDLLTRLPERHPYRIVGRAALAAALEQFTTWAAAAGLPYGGGAVAGDNFMLPSPVGALRPTYLAPQAQQAGDLSRPAPIVVVGFVGLRDFYPQLLADNLATQGIIARAVQLPFDLLTDRRDANTVQLAQALDEPARVERLATAVRNILLPGERVGLPAILGLHQHVQTCKLLGDRLGAPLFEIPTLPPSVPGIRLTTALRHRLEAQGVRVEIGMEGIGFHSEAGEIAWVESATSARPLKHRARAYLLATGGVLGGGFNSDHTGRFWESIFGLPLTVAQDRREWFRPRFFDPAGQPVFHGGVAVNDTLQPVDAAGRTVYRNLWAAGGLLAHCDPILERSLEGIAIATGVAAAEAIAGIGVPQVEIARG
jgi:glycerol-3-phosphate dehydrogenase subunit B